jgi:NADPH:quinone reductase-like Zn-dependent oxidoreductase
MTTHVGSLDMTMRDRDLVNRGTSAEATIRGRTEAATRKKGTAMPNAMVMTGYGPADRAPGALDETMALLADGKLRLRAHQTMPMQQAAEAHRQLEAGAVHEHIILTLP